VVVKGKVTTSTKSNLTYREHAMTNSKSDPNYEAMEPRSVRYLIVLQVLTAIAASYHGMFSMVENKYKVRRVLPLFNAKHSSPQASGFIIALRPQLPPIGSAHVSLNIQHG